MNPQASRARILEAAFEEFATHGLAGARVDRIAANAGLNKRMIYHYFGSKDGLFEALLGWRLAEVRDHEAVADVRLAFWEAAEGKIVDQGARRAAWERRVAKLAAEQRNGRLPQDLDASELTLAMLAIAWFPLAFPQYAKMITGREPGDLEFEASHARFERDLRAVLRGAAEHGAKPRLRYRWT